MKIKHNKSNKESLILFLIAFPLFLIVLAFYYVPLIGWFTTFFTYKPGLPFNNLPYVGPKYYGMVFGSEFNEIRRVMSNTLALGLFSLACFPLPLLVAILLNELRWIKFKRVVQTVTTLPNFIGWVIIFSMSFALFSSDGLVNQLLADRGNQALSVLDNKNVVWFFQTLLSVWKNTGWNAIIYIAAITGIDSEQYEAATVDGAGRFKKVLHITLPGLLPTFFVLFLLNIGWLLNAGGGLDQYLPFYNGLVAPRLETLDYYVYRVGVLAQNYSYATTVGIFKSVISIGLLFFGNLASKRIRGVSLF